VHDIGAPAERVRADGGGLVVPLNLPPERLVALFLDPALFRTARGAGAVSNRLMPTASERSENAA
jgi:hypothetical protein